MPVSYKISVEQRLIEVVYSGELRLEEILAARQQGVADPEFDPSFNVVDDISSVESSKINFDEISRISGESVTNTGVRRALVAVTDFQRGMANMYQVMSSAVGHNFKVFGDYDSAYHWAVYGGDDTE